MSDETTERVEATLLSFPSGSFSTHDFIVRFRDQFPTEWLSLEAEYGAGGKGAGKYWTVSTAIAHQLNTIAKRGNLKKLPFRPAPDFWGNRVIRYWTFDSEEDQKVEIIKAVDDEYREGGSQIRRHLRRERHWGLSKKKKIAFTSEHGSLFCERCGLNPGQAFGVPLGNSIIEVHHRETLVKDMGEDHKTRLADLQCLCANCHRLTHAELVVALASKIDDDV